MEEQKEIQRLVLKEGDVLVVKIPESFYYRKQFLEHIYKNIRRQLYPKKNRVLVVPDVMEFSVIGKEEVKEYVKDIDLWQLFEEGEEENG